MQTATFNATNGQMNVNGMQGRPPGLGFPADAFMQRIQTVINSGGSTDPTFPKSVNSINLVKLGDSYDVTVTHTSPGELPNLTVYDVADPLFRVWVYTNASGTSSILGNSTPGTPVTLIQNGSKMYKAASTPSPPSESKLSGGAIAGIVIGGCFCLMTCTVLIYLAARRRT